LILSSFFCVSFLALLSPGSPMCCYPFVLWRNLFLLLLVTFPSPSQDVSRRCPLDPAHFCPLPGGLLPVGTHVPLCVTHYFRRQAPNETLAPPFFFRQPFRTLSLTAVCFFSRGLYWPGPPSPPEARVSLSFRVREHARYAPRRPILSASARRSQFFFSCLFSCRSLLSLRVVCPEWGPYSYGFFASSLAL